MQNVEGDKCHLKQKKERKVIPSGFFSPKERQFYLPRITSLIILENSVPEYEANLHNVCHTGYMTTQKTHIHVQ